MMGNTSDKCYIYFDLDDRPVVESAVIKSISFDTSVIEVEFTYSSSKEIIATYISKDGLNFYKNKGENEISPNGLNYFSLRSDLNFLGNTVDYYFYIMDTEQKISKTFKMPTYTYTCFPAGTKILTKYGYKNIENIKINDIVYSFNEKTNKVELNTVAKTFIHEDTEIYEIYINDEIIKVTPHHRFYIKRNNKFEWIEVKDLTLTDKLFNNKNKLITINKIEYKKETNIVYNFEVQNNHTYFISNKNILVHNVKAPIKE